MNDLKKILNNLSQDDSVEICVNLLTWKRKYTFNHNYPPTFSQDILSSYIQRKFIDKNSQLTILYNLFLKISSHISFWVDEDNFRVKIYIWIAHIGYEDQLRIINITQKYLSKKIDTPPRNEFIRQIAIDFFDTDKIDLKIYYNLDLQSYAFIWWNKMFRHIMTMRSSLWRKKYYYSCNEPVPIAEFLSLFHIDTEVKFPSPFYVCDYAISEYDIGVDEIYWVKKILNGSTSS